jgi:integrase
MNVTSSVLKRSPRIKRAKLKDGSIKEYKIKGGWFYRLKYTDASGRICTDERGPFDRKIEAKDAMNVEIQKLQATDGRSRRSRRMTFESWADECEKGIFREAEFIEHPDGTREKVAGIKSWKTVRSQLSHLKGFFRNQLITALTRNSPKEYKAYRRKHYRKTPEGEPQQHVSLATVNRELAVLRQMMLHALDEGLITRNIFGRSSNLIELSKEKERSRVLSIDEELRLLAACSGRFESEYTRTIRGKEQTIISHFEIDNRHLRTMIMLAIDSGLRRGEMFKMKWADVDFENNFLHIVTSNTKSEKYRAVPLSARCRSALVILKDQSDDDRPFPFTDIKRSFATAKRLAGVKDLRFHDLRRTASVRWQESDTPLGIASKFLGHSEVKMTVKHYTATDLAAIQEMNERINAFNDGSVKPTPIASEMVN